MTAPCLMWLLVDGLSFPLYQRLAPRLRTPMAHALPLPPLSPNCQTPPSLFSIWSGLPPSAHGLTGYDMPAVNGASPLATRDAFFAWPREVPMAWDRWAAEGGKVRTCAVPFLQADRLGAALLSHTEVYQPEVARPQVLPAGSRLSIAALGIDWRIEADADALLIDSPHAPTRIPFGTTAHLPVTPAPGIAPAEGPHQAVAVHAARIGGQAHACFLGYQPVALHGQQAANRRARLHQRAYTASNPAKLYARGELGPRITEGGQGEAEELLLALLDVLHQAFADDIAWAAGAGHCELIVAYYPVVDLLSHQLLRQVVAPANPREQQLAEVVLARLVGWLDDLLARCLAALPRHARLVAHSDHGMAPIHHEVRPNLCFQQLGWLASDGQGGIDLDRTLAFYHPAENGWLALHTSRLREAGLGPAHIVEALNRAVNGKLDADFRLLAGPPVTVGGGWDGAWYLQPPAGVRLRSQLASPLITPSQKGGDHTCWSRDPWLEGVLLEAGGTPAPWPAGVQLTDLAPALLAWLGTPHTAPAAATLQTH